MECVGCCAFVQLLCRILSNCSHYVGYFHSKLIYIIIITSKHNNKEEKRGSNELTLN